ncbi:oligosaccharide flippase family protein [Altericista sp. CCNU0014]|uniref:oligosaccharide flippase family protein n=1 Tax=Altericista sp. CCNU0014 TaxID=3082949 RepID=UPI00384B0708
MKNTLWMLLSNGGRLILQAGYFIIIARALGPEQYGAFIGATSIVSIVAPFASLGSGHLLIKNVSRNRALFSAYWGNALFMILVSGIALIILIVSISPILLPKTISQSLVLMAAITDLIFFRIIDTAGQAFSSVLWLSRTAQLSILQGITRLFAAFALVSFFDNPNALDWTCFYLVGTIACSFVGIYTVQRFLGSPKLSLGLIKHEIVEGFYFSLGLSSQTIYNDVDKTMLASLSSLEATGVYAAAYRLIDVAFVPIRSLLGAAYAEFFQHGASGIKGSLVLAKRLTPSAGLYGIAAGIGLFYGAPVVQLVFGNEYAGTVEALRWLAPIPFLKSMHYLAADSLTGAGFQGIRSAMQVSIAIFNVLINFWLIPKYSFQGAAWASLASDGLLMLGLWITVIFIYKNQIQIPGEYQIKNKFSKN